MTALVLGLGAEDHVVRAISWPIGVRGFPAAELTVVGLAADDWGHGWLYVSMCYRNSDIIDVVGLPSSADGSFSDMIVSLVGIVSSSLDNLS